MLDISLLHTHISVSYLDKRKVIKLSNFMTHTYTHIYIYILDVTLIAHKEYNILSTVYTTKTFILIIIIIIRIYSVISII